MLPNRAKANSILETGIDIGIAALKIVRGGILVEEGPQQHAWAVQRTQELTANPVIRAIFEAFAFDRILIRAAPMAGIRPIPDNASLVLVLPLRAECGSPLLVAVTGGIGRQRESLKQNRRLGSEQGYYDLLAQGAAVPIARAVR